jgi:hypothetical protein
MATDAAMALVVALTEMVRNGGEVAESAPFDMFDERDLQIDKPRLRHLPQAERDMVLASLEDRVSAGLPPDFDPDQRRQALLTAQRLVDATSMGWGDA